MDRRAFLKTSAVMGAGLTLSNPIQGLAQQESVANGKRIGIIGLDTSHSPAFTQIIHNGGASMLGYRVVAAYPHGSKDIPSALKDKPNYIQRMQEMGVALVDSIEALIEKVDVVLLESNDGRPHLEQVLPVLKAGKRVFVDKPIAHNYASAKAIFKAAEAYNVPIFSASALRFDPLVQQVAKGSIGQVIGADVYTPAELEPNHIDMAWYGIHGVEMLFSVMGPGCKTVSRTHTAGTDMLVGVWEDGRIGTVRGIREGESNIAGMAFGEKGISPLGPFQSYNPLVHEIIQYFETGKVPVQPSETLEIFAFMQAADLSKRKKGAAVRLKY